MSSAATALSAAPAHDTDARAFVVPRLALLHGAALVLVTVCVFANALSNGFVLDDRGILLGNPLVQQLGESWRAFTSPYWPEALEGGQYRPLAILHFALDWRLGGGSAAWFHASNVLWHAVAVVLVWRLALQWLRPGTAWLVASLFAVHPVHVEAVANVVGRLELMAAVFSLGALLMHRRSSWLAVPLFALGLASKENAIVALGLIVANDLLLQRAETRARRRLYAGYAATLAVYAAVLLAVFHDRPFSVQTATLSDASLGTRLWTMATVVPHYLRLLLAPAELSADYEPQVIATVHGPTLAGALGVLLLAGYVAAIVTTWRRTPVLAFALVWVALAIAPVSNVLFVSGVTLSERSLYLPSVAVVIASGVAFDAMLHRGRRPAAIVIVTLLLVLGAARTWTRTPVWRDDRTYLVTLLEDHPESYRAHWVAGRVHRAAGRLDAAEREFELARRIYPRSARVYADAAALAEQMGDAQKAARLRDSAAVLP